MWCQITCMKLIPSRVLCQTETKAGCPPFPPPFLTSSCFSECVSWLCPQHLRASKTPWRQTANASNISATTCCFELPNHFFHFVFLVDQARFRTRCLPQINKDKRAFGLYRQKCLCLLAQRAGQWGLIASGHWRRGRESYRCTYNLFVPSQSTPGSHSKKLEMKNRPTNHSWRSLWRSNPQSQTRQATA